MGWIIVQIPELFCFLLRTRRLFRFFFLFICLLLYCEFFHYFIVLLFCKWPILDMDTLQAPSKSNPLKVMIIADTHILGWREGHWFDKLRRYGETFANDSYLATFPSLIFLWFCNLYHHISVFTQLYEKCIKN